MVLVRERFKLSSRLLEFTVGQMLPFYNEYFNKFCRLFMKIYLDLYDYLLNNFGDWITLLGSM